MAGLLSEMGLDALPWALSASDRLIGMLDLAEPVGAVWDNLRRHFGEFHARWLGFCLSGGSAERAMVPRVLAAVQGRRLIAETLEAAVRGPDASAELLRVVDIKAEMQDLLRQLGVAEGVYAADGMIGPDFGGGGAGGSRSGGAGGMGRPARNEERIAGMRASLSEARGRLTAAKMEAAQDPAFAILTAPLSGVSTSTLASRLAPHEALVLAFPLAVERSGDAEVAVGPAVVEDFATWFWVLRGGREVPEVVRLASRVETVAAVSTAGSVSGPGAVLPAWALSLPDVSARWDMFCRTMSGRGDARSGDWEDVRAEGSGDEGGVAAGAATSFPKTRLSPAQMAGFWGELDQAMAALVWGPLQATGVLDGVEDILIATAGSLHNLPFEAGRGLGRGHELAGARLLHQSSLATFARSRGLFGARPTIRQAPGGVQADAAGPVISLLAHPQEQGIPLAQVERRIAARLWAETGAEVLSGGDYPWTPSRPVAFAHAACHGAVRTPEGGTPGAHLILRSEVSERALLAGPAAGAWLVGACVGGRVHDDNLDGNPTGLVAGALGAGSETLVAAVAPLPDLAGCLFGTLVTLQLTAAAASPDLAVPSLSTAAELAKALISGQRTPEALAAILPRRVLAELGGEAGLAVRLPSLDARLRNVLAEDLAQWMDEGLAPAMTTGRPAKQRESAIGGALNAAAAWWVPISARDGLVETLAALAPADIALDQPTAARPTARLLSSVAQADPDPFSILPNPALDPAETGTIRYATVVFHDPRA